jgi:uncharacterized protein (DUF885 family)
MISKRLLLRWSLPFLFCAGLAMGARVARAADTVSVVNRTGMADVIERYNADLGALQRHYNIGISPTRSERLRRFFEDELKSLEAMNFEALEQADRIDYILLKNRIQFDLRELASDRRKVEEVAPLIPFAGGNIQLEETRRRMEPAAADQGARVLTDISGQIAQARKLYDPAPRPEKDTVSASPSKTAANRAARMVDDLRASLKRWHDFRAGYDPEFTWWATQPHQKVDKELQDYAQFLRRKLAGFVEGQDDPIIGDPIGREALLYSLRQEMIPYTPEELIEIANQEFKWCEVEMKRAASDLGYGGDWHKTLDHVSRMHVKAGEQPALIRTLADEATKFVEDHGLVTVPALCKEIWRMEMMSADRQKATPYFTGGEVISVSYPTATMNFEDKLMSMRGNNIPFCRATVHHEVIPGHHLQTFMSARHRTERRSFRTPFLVEGWALYWEMLLWDMKFPRTAEERVGMLFWRSHRCARIIFSLNFHLGKMTPQEAIDFLVTRVGHERRNATAEVRRSFAGDYGPLYQAAYMLGGLQIRALHKELVETGKMKDLAFHDAILKENAIPVELIRASLVGRPLTRDGASQWRFYDGKRE